MQIKANRALVALLFMLAGIPARVTASQCAPDGSPCEAFGKATAIFIGSVVSSEAVQSGKDYIITAEEVFKGTPEKSMLFFSCFDCVYGGWGYEFVVGERYFIYAYRDSPNIWGASACGRTRKVSEAGEDFEFLRNLPLEGTGERLYGAILEIDYEALARGQQPIPIVGAFVTIEGQGQHYTVTTDGEGQYELSGLMPGIYQVSFKIVEGSQEYLGPTHKINIFDRGCSRMNFPVRSGFRSP